jgi:hypothetical protein
MKVLKQILFAVAITICFTLTASAQKQDDKKPPEKKNPPEIEVVPKDRPKDRPKEEDKPKNDKKKPQTAYLKISNEDNIRVV